jgi:hypothetical protein
MPIQEDPVEVRLAQISAQLAALTKSLNTVQSALVQIIEVQREQQRVLAQWAPILRDVETRFVKDGKLKLPGLFS